VKGTLVLVRSGSTSEAALGDWFTRAGVADGTGVAGGREIVSGAGFVDEAAAAASVDWTLLARCALEGGSSCRISGNWSSESRAIFLIHLSRHECQVWCGYLKNVNKNWPTVLPGSYLFLEQFVDLIAVRILGRSPYPSKEYLLIELAEWKSGLPR
jgi:hypothetical protein